MIKSLKILWIFYFKLLIPAVLFSLLMNSQLGFTFNSFGLCFLVFFPSLHFLIYELRLKDEYSFYANFGFSRLFLWILTFTLSITINMVSKSLRANYMSTVSQNLLRKRKFCETSILVAKQEKLLDC